MRRKEPFLILLILFGCASTEDNSSWCSWVDDDSFVETSPPEDLVAAIDMRIVKTTYHKPLASEDYVIWKENSKGDILGCFLNDVFDAPMGCWTIYDYFAKGDQGWKLNKDKQMIVMCHEKP